MGYSSRTFQRVKVAVQPVEEPVTLEEVKAQARILHSEEDALLTSYIVAARLAIEKYLTRKLVTQTLQAFMDEFPNWSGGAWWSGVRQGTPASTGITSERSILLDWLPVQSVSSIKTFNDADVEATFDSSQYRVDANDPDLPARISLIEGAVWPVDLRPTAAILIEYVAGYGLAVDVPEDIKLALKMIVAYWYTQREAACDINRNEVPLAYRYLIDQYKLMTEF